jgi:hypothetical protein
VARPKMQVAGCCGRGDELAVPMNAGNSLQLAKLPSYLHFIVT